MPLPRRTCHLLAWTFWLLCPCMGSAQLPQASDTTSTPIPGAGHDYIQAPAETVNPANGSVSIRIPLRIPSGRQLTIPFSIAYDSAGAFYYGESLGNTSPHYATITNVPFSRGGWSYTFPLLTNTQESWPSQGPTGKNITCTEAVNYVFQDPAGNRHNLGLAVNTSVPALLPYCGGSGNDIRQGGEGSISATSQNRNTATITDGHGTVYAFSVNPTTITDRNGNTISLSGSVPPVSVTDTLGRTAINVGSFGANPDTINVAGLTSPYKANWTTASATFNIGVYPAGSCPTSLTGSASVISQIILPNGQKYTMSYDSAHGMLNKITYPSGGYVRYVWGLNPQAEAGSYPYSSDSNGGIAYLTCRYDFPAITERYVSFDGATEVLHQHFSYSTSWPSGAFAYTSKTTTVTTYDLVRSTSFNTVYTYSPILAPCVPELNPNSITGCVGDPTQQSPLEQTIQYYDTNGSLLKTVSKTWQNPRLLSSQQTTLPNNQVSESTWTYNSNEMQIEQDDYDFGANAPGPFLRATVTNYAAFGTNHIVDDPSSVIVYSDSGKTNRVGETDYTYDVPVGTTTSGIVQHGTGCNCGNLTKESRWINSGGTTLNTTFTNDDTGQRLSMTDPKGNQTTYSYTDSYSSGTPPGPTNAYLTTVTYPNTGVAHTEKFAYAYGTGEVTSSTDQNNQVTTYKYVDSLARLTEIDYPTPDGGITTKNYIDTPLAVSIETKSQIDNARWTDSFVLYDGLMHPIAASSANGETIPWDRVDTCYDGRGFAKFRSYPYQINSSTAAPNCTSGTGDTLAYDALGRSKQVSHSDGNTVLTNYSGRATQVQDEGNGTQRVTRISQTDGFGRLSSICEVALAPFVGPGGASSSSLIGSNGTPAPCGLDISGTGFLTTYQYDVLDNLLQVNQTGVAARTFAYDSLSRLTTATNPESGTISYTYDANGNLATKIAPAPNQTTGTVTTTYSYDALNRLTSKTYSDGTTPQVTFNYDVDRNGTARQNSVGRLASESTGDKTYYDYDRMGRIVSRIMENFPSGDAVYTYTYNSLGNVTSDTEGFFTPAKSYFYNVASRLTSITTGTWTGWQVPTTLFSNAHYNALGNLSSATLGDGETESYTYSNRGWLNSSSATYNTTNVYSLTVAHAPNGDVITANDSANGNWAYGYDAFNRLVCANLSNGTCASPTNGQPTYNYVYDRFGNRWQQNGPHSMLLTFSGSNNRMDGYSYDAAGNLLNDGTHSYTYDAENRISKVDGGSTATYYYDAEGHSVQKTISASNNQYEGPGTWYFLYGLNGRLVAELTSGVSFWRGEVYAGDRHLASIFEGDTYFDHQDQVGSERARFSYYYKSNSTSTSLPFGDWFTWPSTNASPINFTGQRRDPESGLDDFGARYDSSSIGRFMSPDPSNVSGDVVDLATPQAWNMYSYVLNNPLNAVDPDGLDYYLIGGDRCGQDGIQCDKQGYVLDNNGNRTVVTDEQINGSNGLAKIDENGNLLINTAQGTFQGEFFDPHPLSVTVTPSFEDQKFMALQDAGAIATPGVNVAMAITAPQLIVMGGTAVALSGAGSTLTLEAAEIAASPGEVAELSQAAAQGGRAAVKKALRSFAKRLAQHQADLAKYESQGGYTSKTVGEIKHFQTMIRLAEDWLIKNP